MKKEFKVISELIENKSKALDVGCGDGELLKYLLENKTKDIRGLEISKESVQNCLSKGLSSLSIALITLICLSFGIFKSSIKP